MSFKNPFALSRPDAQRRAVSKGKRRSCFDTPLLRQAQERLLSTNGFLKPLCLCVSVVILLSGCEEPAQQYEGPQRPFSEISRLCCRVAEVHGSLIGDKLRLEAIDGRDAGWFDTWTELLPGRHEVSYAYLQGLLAYPLPVLPYSTDRGRMIFNAQPGRGYILKADRQGDRVWAWIEDEASRDLVAGQRPPL